MAIKIDNCISNNACTLTRDDTVDYYALWIVSNTPVPTDWNCKTFWRWGFIKKKDNILEINKIYEEYDREDFIEVDRIPMYGKGDIVFYKIGVPIKKWI